MMAGFIYIIRCADYAKVGYSTNIKNRLIALKSMSPLDHQLLASFPGNMALERRLHEYLAPHRHRGEWFKWCEALDKIVRFGIPSDDLPPPRFPCSAPKQEPTELMKEIFGARIRVRETQADFGRRFGVEQSTINRWENIATPVQGSAPFLIQRVLADLASPRPGHPAGPNPASGAV